MDHMKKQDYLSFLFIITFVLVISFIIPQYLFGIPAFGATTGQEIQKEKEEYIKQKEQGRKALEDARATRGSNPIQTVHKVIPNFISIEPSKTCKLSKTPNCPTIKALLKYDTTNPIWSGAFVEKNGTYQRVQPMAKNHYLFYPPAKYPFIICVDCTKNVLQNSRTIFIEASNFVFVNNNEIIKNFTRTEVHYRIMDGCNQATIIWNQALLADTIEYMKSNCTTTNFTTTQSFYMTPHDIDPTTTKQFKYQQWLKNIAKPQAKQNCVTNKCVTKDTRYS